jgi:hypothetical protein
VAGRVVREYVGTGPAAEQAAAQDAQRRADRLAQAQARQAEQSRWESAEGPLKEFDRAAGLAMRAALLAAGYFRHSRGPWRPRHD